MGEIGNRLKLAYHTQKRNPEGKEICGNMILPSFTLFELLLSVLYIHPFDHTLPCFSYPWWDGQ